MSRIGKQVIEIPEGVTVSQADGVITVKGPKGELTDSIRAEIEMKIDGNTLTFVEKQKTKESNAFWGLARALVANMIVGVTEGYEKKLELVGVGYRVQSAGGGLTFALGYSHPIEYKAPEGIELKVEDNKTISVSGIDKQLVGQTAAHIRSFRKPEVYKGKGVKYVDEVIKMKPGKAGKV